MINALADVQNNWRMIGVYMKLKGRLLDAIEQRCRRDATRCLEEMVRTWLSLSYDVKKYGRPTWQFVIMAVAKGSGNNRYAGELATKFRRELKRPWHNHTCEQQGWIHPDPHPGHI